MTVVRRDITDAAPVPFTGQELHREREPEALVAARAEAQRLSRECAALQAEVERLTAGRDAAVEAAVAEAERRIAQTFEAADAERTLKLEGCLRALSGQFEDHFRASEDLAVATVAAVVQRLTGDAEFRRDAVLNLVHETLAVIGSAIETRVAVSPEDFREAPQISVGGRMRETDAVLDPSVAQGAARITFSAGHADIDIKAFLESLAVPGAKGPVS